MRVVILKGYTVSNLQRKIKMPRKKIPNQINKQAFLRALSKQAGFTYDDTEAFWNAFIQLIINSLIAGKTLNLSGFGKLYVKTMAPHKAWIGLQKKYKDIGESNRINFTISGALKRMLKEEMALRKEQEEWENAGLSDLKKLEDDL
jgi:nucleoid DNA-binding protein